MRVRNLEKEANKLRYHTHVFHQCETIISIQMIPSSNGNILISLSPLHLYINMNNA